MKEAIKALVDPDHELDWITNYVRKMKIEKPDLRVLDVGCGFGRVLSKITDMGITSLGVDANPEIIAHNRSRNLKCVTATEFTSSESNKNFYDLVVMSHVIEHFSPESLLEFFDSYLPCLKTGGRLIIATPFLTSYFYDDFDHVRPYTPGSISMILSGEQRQVRFRSRPRMQVVEYWTRRAPLQIRYSRLLVVGGVMAVVPRLVNLCFKVIFRISLKRIGLVDGWVGVFQKE